MYTKNLKTRLIEELSKHKSNKLKFKNLVLKYSAISAEIRIKKTKTKMFETFMKLYENTRILQIIKIYE